MPHISNYRLLKWIKWHCVCKALIICIQPLCMHYIRFLCTGIFFIFFNSTSRTSWTSRTSRTTRSFGVARWVSSLLKQCLPSHCNTAPQQPYHILHPLNYNSLKQGSSRLNCLTVPNSNKCQICMLLLTHLYIFPFPNHSLTDTLCTTFLFHVALDQM